MLTFISQDKIKIFQNLFRGREDVFAMRWEKRDKSVSGYMPVCINEWTQGTCLKLNHGHCRDCQNKEYAKWSDFYLRKHLLGQRTYGIYPLLKDNTSYFLVIDFDGSSWNEKIKKFIKLCLKNNLNPILERSRSGKGAHLWFFFKDKYPAIKSRNIFLNLLRQAKIVSEFSADDSFDRIFPNQDFLNKDGIGNLIALPLQGQSIRENKTVFLDINNGKEIKDQWQHLSNIQKIPFKILDKIYQKFNNQNYRKANKISAKALKVILAEEILIENKNLPSSLTSYLRQNLNFINLEYVIKKKMGINVYNVERFFNLINARGDFISIPRGFLNQLAEFLVENEIEFEIEDERFKDKKIDFKSNLKLLDYQKEALKHLLIAENGVLVAPPGSGKTIIGLELIARLKQPALILTHKRQIFNQWKERIENFLNIPQKDIGQFGANKKELGEKITIAMIQTLNRIDFKKEFKNKFGLVLVDECHHLPAKMFRGVITQLNPYYLFGLTATLERKYKDEKLIFLYLGDILYTITNKEKEPKTKIFKMDASNSIKINIQKTKFEVPFKVYVGNLQLFSRILIHDTNRNQQIVSDIAKETKKNKKCLVLTERKEHVEVLNQYLKNGFEVITLTGNLSERKKKEGLKQIEDKNFQIIIATGQLLGEGTDINGLDTLFLVYPFSFHGKLTQYIGRITRNFGKNNNNSVYDYRDGKVEYLEKLFKKRATFYKKKLF